MAPELFLDYIAGRPPPPDSPMQRFASEASDAAEAVTGIEAVTDTGRTRAVAPARARMRPHRGVGSTDRACGTGSYGSIAFNVSEIAPEGTPKGSKTKARYTEKVDVYGEPPPLCLSRPIGLPSSARAPAQRWACCCGR
jgi:hypothetical protein